MLTAGLRPLIYCAAGAPERELPATVVRVPVSDDGLSMDAVLSDLAQRGLLSVLVEGGGRVHHSLLRHGVVDQVQLFIAPLVLAGGPGWVQGQPFSLGGAPRFQVQELGRAGDDLHVVLELDAKSEASSV